MGFGPALSVIHGPSDTGKSFIVDAIDFALGSKKLKVVKGLEPYSHVLLGLKTIAGENFTLARPIKGGRVSLYEGDIRSTPTFPPEQTLATQHNAVTDDNLSRFLLKLTGFDGLKIRRNARNETDSLSFRNLAHFAVVDETQMQSELEPVYTGISPTTRTKELSVLKLLLEGRDDSDLTAISATPQQKRAKAAKAEVVETLIRDVDLKLHGVAEESELRDQLSRINASTTSLNSLVSDAVGARAEALELVTKSEGDVKALRADFLNTRALAARLGLLDTQYASDLSRLDMISEVGSLLGFFSTAVCPFCGSTVSDSSKHEFAHQESVPFADAVKSEIEKTSRLHEDLRKTLSDLETDQVSIREEHSRNLSILREREQALRELDASHAPALTEIRELQDLRLEVEKSLALWDQLTTYRTLLADIQAETTAEKAAQAESIGLLTIDAFSSQVSDVLTQWGYPDAEHSKYDRAANDIVADGQLRSGHGKGVRAVLHAAFTIALAQYCVSKGLPHPGFVVLDSPLVTYKPPKNGDEDLSDEASLLPPDFAARFYASVEDLASNVQVIVMENVNPPASQGGGLEEIEFSKSTSGSLRYGFFPYAPSSPTASE
ncbi:hypothetical protein ACFWGP_06880 [Agromyces sp. NPDC127015]|uniref:hypothetical protein n=1 Tax=Agromyces sp. NPDC127015 TaxID=3347108 RepID=UPI00365B62D0